MNTGLKIMWLGLMTIVGVFFLIAVFPMILEGVDAVNETTNVTQYYGLKEINNFSPSILWILFLIILFGSFAWLFRGKIRQILGGGGGGE